MQPTENDEPADDYKRTPLLELQKRELLGGQEHCYLIRTGAVALFATNDIGYTGCVGLYFKDDRVAIPRNCWLEGLIYTSLEKIEASEDLLMGQFGEVCGNILEVRNLPMKNNVYRILKRFWNNQIGGVNITDLARMAGYSREITGKRIQELCLEGRIKKLPKATWEVIN